MMLMLWIVGDVSEDDSESMIKRRGDGGDEPKMDDKKEEKMVMVG